MSQKKKLKHKKTGVILEYKYGNYYVDGVDVPDWYVKLHLNVNTKYNVIQKDEWDELATFDINYVKEICPDTLGPSIKLSMPIIYMMP